MLHNSSFLRDHVCPYVTRTQGKFREFVIEKGYSRIILPTSSELDYCRTGHIEYDLSGSRHLWRCILERWDWTIWSVSKAETVQPDKRELY
jgi:hypothetical protein